MFDVTDFMRCNSFPLEVSTTIEKENLRRHTKMCSKTGREKRKETCGAPCRRSPPTPSWSCQGARGWPASPRGGGGPSSQRRTRSSPRGRASTASPSKPPDATSTCWSHMLKSFHHEICFSSKIQNSYTLENKIKFTSLIWINFRY